MYLDAPVRIMAGREIWGFPKKEAEIDLQPDPDEEEGRVFLVDYLVMR